VRPQATASTREPSANRTDIAAPPPRAGDTFSRMTDDTWLDLGPLSDIPEDRPVLRKAAGRRFACVRAGEAVHAIDDRCPHQGYPLSQGSCKDGVLTCEWHNWKFELTSGECLFGGEAVRRYPTRIQEGRVHLSVAVDVEREAARLRAGLDQALLRDEMARALREALRLGPLVPHPRSAELGPLAAAFELVARDSAQRAEYGFDHALALFADLTTWVERGWIGAEEAFVAAAHAVAEPSLHRSPRPVVPAELAPADALDAPRACEALVEERRAEAEARVRAIARARGAEAASALLPFVARHLYDYGHGAIFTAKASEIVSRFPALAEDVFGALAVSLAWATAETALPPFTATRDALERLGAASLPAGTAPLDRAERAAYEAAVLSGEAAAAAATVDLLARGVDPRSLLRAAGHAAAERLARFDRAWEERLDAEASVLDVTHTVTFAESALALAESTSPRDAARLAVLAAAFVGKVRAGDRADASDPAPSTTAPDLASAVTARDAGSALALARRMSPDERRAAYAQVAPFAAFDAATRPIFYAHTVKVTEALHRLERDDPFADAAYLVACLSYILPPRRELRIRRIAHVAKKFLADGRPPEGLY
jgi:nitrite reductase/ring-hydroxylating ferredoxin subunit